MSTSHLTRAALAALLFTSQASAQVDEDASDDAALNDDVLRGIAASGGARQPEADEASLASRATSAHTVIPTPHGRVRMGERAVSVKELQTAKKYGTVCCRTRGRPSGTRAASGTTSATR